MAVRRERDQRQDARNPLVQGPSGPRAKAGEAAEALIKVRFEPEAQKEFSEAGEWYAERGDALPTRFSDEVAETIRAITTNPAADPIVVPIRSRLPVRKARLSRFPFYLVYVACEREVRVLAVARTSRRPLYWRGRVAR